MDELCRIELLGGLRIRQGGQIITRFKRQKTGALLAYLAYYSTQHHSREALAEIIWPEALTSRNQLRIAISELRSILKPPNTSVGSVLQEDGDKIGINLEAAITDVNLFQQALQNVSEDLPVSEQIGRLDTVQQEKVESSYDSLDDILRKAYPQHDAYDNAATGS